MDFIKEYLTETIEIANKLDFNSIQNAIALLSELRHREGRLFILGVGGSAANASHAVNDFRKIIGIEAYAPTDNVSELTARTNDEGWDTTFSAWLIESHLRSTDLVMVLSVGGGDSEAQVSPNLVQAVNYAREVGAKIIGIVGRNGGYTRKAADVCILIPTVNVTRVTPHTEGFQAIIWHLIVSHPLLQLRKTKWESITAL